MKAVNTLRVAGERVFFGPGPCQLLQTVEQTASLRKATIQLGLSYTKALRMIRDVEAGLGCPVVQSSKGGNQHGGTQLTPEGKALVKAYTKVAAELEQAAQELVKQHIAPLVKQ